MKLTNVFRFIVFFPSLADFLVSATSWTDVQTLTARQEYKHMCKKLLHTNEEIRRKPYFDLHYTYAQRQAATMQGWEPRRCPDFTDYITTHDEPGMRSISPYGPIHDYDPMRRPRVIIHQACLCQYCFDPATMAPDHNLASYNLTSSIHVSYGAGRATKYEVKTGCACVVPTTHLALE